MNIDDFYEVNDCKHYPIHWFVGNDHNLHYVCAEKITASPPPARMEVSVYDGETHFSDGKVKDLILDQDTYLVSYKDEPDQFYRLKAEDRVVGELTFFHWRHGIYTETGI